MKLGCVCPPQGLDPQCGVHGLPAKERARTRKFNQGRSRKPLAQKTYKQELLDARWAGVKDGMLFMARKLDPDGPSCEECGVRGNKDTLDLHHLRSRAQGGSYEARNGMLVCRPCHQRLTGGIQWTNA